ncbi:AAA family ATPase [Nocardioides convexus]|uniref:ParA family protein n=1 Tax=Nocardioides convexus TaxID=2712224 RepID=UPI002418B6E8|nr:AAA family ATPase [Nocardioides convexus]
MLRGVMEDLAASGTHYDWVLLDCPPSLGVLTVAALTAASGVLIPLQCETLSHRGVGQPARHRPRRPPLHQPRPRRVGRPPDLVRRADQPRAGGARHHLRDLRPRGRRAADPEDDQVRRGACRRPLDPRHQPHQQGRAGLPRGGRRPARPGGALSRGRTPSRLRRAGTGRRWPASGGPPYAPATAGSPPSALPSR